ncbi:MAG: hypothetical protein OK422_00255 [Thaumarchaeota archaeon]|nr:hypothetical protein [Nitrososphaerota archaeon]
MVTVLGVNVGHDSSAALVEDGRVIGAVEEERFVDVKHYKGPPINSLNYVLSLTDPDEIDLVAIDGLILYAFREARRLYPASVEGQAALSILGKMARNWNDNAALHFLLRAAAKMMGKPLSHLSELEPALQRFKDKIVLVEHHHAHAMTAYCTKPWQEDTLVLTLDMYGDGLCASVNVGRGGNLTRVASSKGDASLGLLYTRVTKMLGLKPEEDEYKVMGLAPYGRPDSVFKLLEGIIELPKGGLSFEGGSLMKGEGREIHTEFLRRRLAGERFDNIAAGVQSLLERLACNWVENCVKHTGISRVAGAGGVFLNVKMNQAIKQLGSVDDLFVYPVSTDSGGAIGAALEGYRWFCERDGLKPTYTPVSDLYLGPEYSDEQIAQALRSEGLEGSAKHLDDIDADAAELVAKGKVVGRFRGREELGPRALGNRSILARADDHHMIKRINEKVKQRTWWMPFAPTILERRSDEYLVDGCSAPYMVLSFDTTEKRREIEAAIHPYDLTCRPQTLDRKWNEAYYRLLSEYEKITGFGGLLNTSFNLHGHTMVLTPAQAIWTFKNSGLDALALGNFLLEKNGS